MCKELEETGVVAWRWQSRPGGALKALAAAWL